VKRQSADVLGLRGSRSSFGAPLLVVFVGGKFFPSVGNGEFHGGERAEGVRIGKATRVAKPVVDTCKVFGFEGNRFRIVPINASVFHSVVHPCGIVGVLEVRSVHVERFNVLGECGVCFHRMDGVRD